MSEPIQTPDEGTETTEPVTQEEITEEVVDPEETTPAVEVADASTEASQSEDTSTATPVQPQADYKQKFVDSQREAILLNERLKLEQTRIESLTKQDTPTDEAMKALYPEWDKLDEYNKRVLIRQETIVMQNARVIAEQQELRERQRLEDELDSVIDTNPKLQGKAAEFKRFARSPKNRGISAEVLAKAFLFDASNDETPNPTPMPRAEGLPSGNGGPREPLKPKKISIEEAAQIRKTDSKRWLELVKSGQIEDDI